MRKLSEIDEKEILDVLGKARNGVEALRMLDVNPSGGSKKSLRKFITDRNLIPNFEKKMSKVEYILNPKTCKVCGKPIDWNNRTGDFCSRSCAASFNNTGRTVSIETKTKISEAIQRNNPNFNGNVKPLSIKQSNNKIEKERRYCANCGKQLNSSQEKFCSGKCLQELKYKEYIKRWKQGLEDGLKGEFGISKYIRRYLFETRHCECEVCGWNKVNPFTNTIPLEIHHKDGNYLNNTEDNLQILCPNCHSLTETHKSHNKNGRKGRKKYYSDIKE